MDGIGGAGLDVIVMAAQLTVQLHVNVAQHGLEAESGRQLSASVAFRSAKRTSFRGAKGDIPPSDRHEFVPVLRRKRSSN
jgi:hypothetical protein